MADPNTTFEKFALIVMLCSPTSLNRAWTEGDKATAKANVKAKLEELRFSAPMKASAIDLTEVLFEDRMFFRGIADLLKEETYAGDEPHPPDEMANAMIEALQKLDAYQA
ncbi:MAG: hypothetical protein ABIQ52_21160 [Vicinamibacterales bacterium]